MATVAPTATAGAAAAGAGAEPSLPVYDWEEELAKNPLLPLLDKYMYRIMARNFPGEAERYAPRAVEQPATRFAPAPPAPKVAPVQAVPVQAALAAAPAPTRDPQFIHVSDYLSEASSEVESREIDPMDELSDFEPQRPGVSGASKEKEDEEEEEDVDMGVDMDVDSDDDSLSRSVPAAAAVTEQEDATMDGADRDAGDDDDEEEPTVCAVCRTSENESSILICDGCEDEYHTYCLQPPLTGVPEGDWFCPKCAATRRPEPTTGGITAAPVEVKQEPTPLRGSAPADDGDAGSVSNGQSADSYATSGAASTGATTTPVSPTSTPGPSTNGSATADQAANGNGAPSTSTLPSIAQTLEASPSRSNSLLVHVCNCEETRCTSAEFQELCPHMKRFLRSACWATHNDRWLASRLAQVTAELLAYHAMNCSLPQCNVPLCEKIRAEEFV